MQLSKLEINGFKSFGDKVTINFDEGITGIVGPNGCGKSNIVDAIRWVLGEQKIKSLRSDKMQNVIFNGTKKRKGTQMAEVSLTFENTKNILPTEYSNVTITRKFYRSGEGEYLMNGVPCRLKDITTLFMDTGIGPDSYAIIELKMVDDILSNKDNSRRVLFEEAAGVSKFKKRKQETFRKLDDTDADLERVDDLLFEIEKNQKALEKQARQAVRYQKLKQEYKEKSIELARNTLGTHQEVYQGLTHQIEKENDKKVKLNKEIRNAEARVEKLKGELIIKEKALASTQKDLNEHVNQIRHYESDKQIKNERLKYLEDKSENLRDQITQDKQSKDRATFSIQSLNREQEHADIALKEIREKVDTAKAEFDSQQQRTVALQEEVNTFNQLVRTKQDEVFQLKKEQEIKQIQLSGFKSELEKTATDSSEKSASLIEFEKKIKSLESSFKTRSDHLENLQKHQKKIEHRKESIQKTLEVIRDESSGLNRKLDARQNEYNLTKSMIDNLEGFPEAIKFLKKESPWGKKALLLSDIISCDERYRVTIENFLEPIMNYYVVNDLKEAYEAVNLLSDAGKGKANFFVLKSFENFKGASTQIFDNAFPASEIVDYDKKYQKLVSYVLNNAYITQGNPEALPENDNAIFITENGKLTKRRYSVSGGSVGLFEGKKIGRIKNLEKLDREIKKLQKQLTELEDTKRENEVELKSLQESTKQPEVEIVQAEINQINEELIAVKTKHEQFIEILSSSDHKKEDVLERIKSLEKSTKKLSPQYDKENKALADLEKKLGLMNEDLQSQNDLLNQKLTAQNQESIFFHQQENRVSSINQEITYKKQALENSEERIKKNQEDLTSTDASIKSLIENSESSDDELIALYKVKDDKEEGVNQTEKDYYEARGNIEEVEKEAREIQRSRETVDALLMELQTRLNDTKLELTSVKERLSVEFNIDLEEILKGEIAQDPDIDIEELMAKVQKLKDKIEDMGPVNPMAKEAFDEIQKRHEFITEQKDDLLKAKESLLTTIEEIDLAAKANFLEAFEKIKYNFIKVFRSLFTEEDDCDLVLEDPSNPLESHIEIIAKPKGKKPLTINQLSGGEKTLTATSLLFAIYLLKPAPFCIFDEVDAPLDDANIDKFNNIIADFSQDSQFIIVTHNKRTMARTEVIYGITMVEQGVSKVVPVNLKELVD